MGCIGFGPFAVRVGQEDRAVVGVEQVLGVTGDAVHHRGQVQRRGNVAADLGELAEEARRGRTSDWLFVAVIVGALLALLFASIGFTVFFFWYVATHLQFVI